MVRQLGEGLAFHFGLLYQTGGHHGQKDRFGLDGLYLEDVVKSLGNSVLILMSEDH